MSKKLIYNFLALIFYSSVFSVIYYFSENYVNVYSNQYYKVFNNLISSSNPTIFCFILTSKNNLDSRVKVTYEAWAHKCDDHSFVLILSGQKSDGKRIHSQINSTFNLLQPEGLLIDSYRKLTDKVYRMFLDAFKYNSDYDWYVKADDDTFFFVDNLRNFLKTKNYTEPVSYGYDMKMIVEGGYHSGGAGYVISNEALTRLGSALTQNYSSCPNSGIEDTDCGACLNRLGVKNDKSTDLFGKERFFPQSILDFVNGMNTGWLESYAKNPVPAKVIDL